MAIVYVPDTGATNVHDSTNDVRPSRKEFPCVAAGVTGTAIPPGPVTVMSPGANALTIGASRFVT